MRQRLVLGLGFLLAACGGDGGVDAPCHATTECAAGLGCAGPNDPQVCGIPPREPCADDAQCAGARCHVIADPCSPDGFGSECRSACGTDPDCGAGFRCDAGACAAVRCDAGATCAGREVCDPSRITATTPTHDRTDGCYPVACTSDAGCGDRTCVNGACQDSIGTCEEPVLVP